MKTILIVDDMAVIREPIAATLKLQGYATICASSGQEALSLLRSNKPDLLLLDVVMPEMDGLQVLRAMRADASLPQPPVILLTAMDARAHVLAARELGVKHYLLKSQFSLEEMINRVRHVLSEGGPGTEKSGVRPEEVGAQRGKAGESGAPSVAGKNVASQASAPQGRSAESSANAPTPLVLHAIKPIMIRSELLRRLEAGPELKALSPTVTELMQLTESSDASAERVAKAIKRDPSVALKVLRLANSAAYSRGDRVESVDQAVVRIGMGQIRQAVLNISVLDRFKSSGAEGGLDVLQFWEHAIACGLIAAQLARARGGHEPDVAFTMGLLHDIGRIVCAEELGESYTQVLRVAGECLQPVEQVELQMLQINHAEITDKILRAWRFPQTLIEPIAYHHMALSEVRKLARQRTPEVATLALADRLAHALMLGSSGNESIYPTEELCGELQIDASVISQIEDTASEQTDEVKFAMLSASSHDAWPLRRELHRANLGVPFNPIYVSAEPSFDAHRIFCEQLADRTQDKPTIGVLYLSSAREQVSVCAAYEKAEAEAGVHGLPLIVISPDGKLRPEEKFVADRNFQCLATPFAIARFIQIVQQLLREPARHAQAA